MAFTNLEQRFNQRVNQLYSGATTKFTGGKSSNGRTDEPYLVRRPGENQRGLSLEGRGAPVISAANDVRRLSLFQISSRGLIFLGKQQLLQTGNTFASTRLLNPTFVVGNAIPFTHIQRHINTQNPIRSIGRSLVGGLLGQNIANRIFGSGKPSSIKDLRRIAQLQQETYDKLAPQTASSIVSKTIGNLIRKIPVIGKIVSAVSAKRSMGETNWNFSRPELGRDDSGYTSITKTKYGAVSTLGAWSGNYTTYLEYSNNERKWQRYEVNNRNSDYIRYSRTRALYTQPADNGYRRNLLSSKAKRGDLEELVTAGEGPLVGPASFLRTLNSINYATREQERIFQTKILTEDPDPKYILPASPSQFVKYFLAGESAINTRDGGTNARDIAKNQKLKRYVHDPLNTPNSTTSGTNSVLRPYDVLPQIISTGEQTTELDDIIRVSFAMGKNNHVQFRAFLKDLNESIQPQYKPYQYIGRIEKFVTFTGVQRDVSLKLSVIAFSEKELDIVWTRINYLTAMAFPYGFNQGIFQPNIIRMTIGDVYKDQPAYITALSTVFNEISETWEIKQGKQVPIAATMNMRFTLIEKDSKWAEKPFYGITEKLTDQFSSPPPSATTTETQAPDRSVDEGTTTPPQTVERTSPAAASRNTTSGTQTTISRDSTSSTNQQPTLQRGVTTAPTSLGALRNLSSETSINNQVRRVLETPSWATSYKPPAVYRSGPAQRN